MRLREAGARLIVAGGLVLSSTAVNAADDARQGVIEARTRLIRALESNDVEGILASLTADHVTLAPDEPALTGARALREWHERRITASPAMKGAWTFDELRVDGDAAVDTFRSVWTVAPRAGGASASTSMSLKGIWS